MLKNEGVTYGCMAVVTRNTPTPNRVVQDGAALGQAHVRVTLGHCCWWMAEGVHSQTGCFDSQQACTLQTLRIAHNGAVSKEAMRASCQFYPWIPDLFATRLHNCSARLKNTPILPIHAQPQHATYTTLLAHQAFIIKMTHLLCTRQQESKQRAQATPAWRCFPIH